MISVNYYEVMSMCDDKSESTILSHIIIISLIMIVYLMKTT